MHGHNLWRQLLLKHYSPTPGGKPLQAPLCHANWGSWTTEQQIARLSWWKKHDLPMELYWMDIGWERDPTDAEAKEHLATCVIDEKKHPGGLKPISDACHKLGMKYLLWFGSGRLWPSVERVQKFRPDLLSPEYPRHGQRQPDDQQVYDRALWKQVRRLGRRRVSPGRPQHGRARLRPKSAGHQSGPLRGRVSSSSGTLC